MTANYKTLGILKNELEPYLFFWEEWIRNGNCNLNIVQIELLNNYIANNFQPNGINEDENYIERDSVLLLINKLTRGQQIFKDFVIVNFLTGIITIAKKYGFDEFLKTPVNRLNINSEIKIALSAFQTFTVGQIFSVYSAEDFSQDWIYNKIRNFQVAKKKTGMLITKRRQLHQPTV